MTGEGDRSAGRMPGPRTVLVWVVILQALGVGLTSALGEVAVESWLLYNTPLRDPWLTLVADAGAWSCLASALAGAWIRDVRWAGLLWGWVTAWFLAEAAVGSVAEVGAFMELTVPAHAVRIVAPAVLAVDALVSPKQTSRQLQPWLVRALMIATGLTFLAHGLEAYFAHPRFIDYLVVFCGQIGFDPQQASLETTLVVIGVIDMLVALPALTLRRWRPVYAYMAVWATIAAASRVVHSGAFGVSDMLIRAANGGVAAAIFVHVWHDGFDEDS